MMNKKTIAAGILTIGFFLGLAGIRALAAANDSSITVKKDATTGLFTLTISDPDGIQEFSMVPAGKLPYGGQLSGCPRTFSSNNVTFADPSDFQPVMAAHVIDCRNNTADLEIAPPEKGFARSKVVVKTEEVAAPAPTPVTAPAEKHEGPLSAADIRYPVPELGDCKSEAECRSYCDNTQRGNECFAFAKKYNLITEKEFKDAEKKFFEVTSGPGGCNSGSSCETYCNNVDHLDECIAFAEKSGYYSGDKLAEAKKFQAVVKTGTPLPGGCKDRNTCELYCNDSRHMEECLNFAEATGFLSKEEIDEGRKVLPFIQRGETPGGCTSKELCEKYCAEDSHATECIAFAEKAGFISPEDAAMIKKTGGKGPGNCHSKQQCDAYCETNGDACFQWAQDNGLINEADLAKMKNGLSKFKEQLDKIPPEVTQCLKDAVGEKNFEKLVDGQPVFDRSLEGKMRSCFSQITAQFSQQLNTLPPDAIACIKDTIGEDTLKKLQSGEVVEDFDGSVLEGCFQQIQEGFGGGSGGPGGPGGGPGGQGGFTGPGGCKSIDECTAYCQDHQDECQNFGPPGGGGPGGPGGPGSQGGNQGGPGGCKSQEECTAYCKDHLEECKNFGGGQGGNQGGPGGGNQGGPSGGGPPPPTPQSQFDFIACRTSCIQKNNQCFEASKKNGVLDQAVAAECSLDQSDCLDECGDRRDFPVVNPTTETECRTSCINDSTICSRQSNRSNTRHKGEFLKSCIDKRDNVCIPSCVRFRSGATAPTTPPPPSVSGFQGGPGGCQSAAECQAYCQAHYTDPACGGGALAPTPSPTPLPATQSCVPPPSGLVSWWNGDTVSGTTASDIKGGNNGTLLNEIATLLGEPGAVTKAFKFSGNGYIKMGNPASLNFGTGPFSLEAWFNWDGGDTTNNIIRKSNYPVSGPGAGYFLRTGSGTAVNVPGPIVEFFVGDSVGEGAAPSGHIYVAINPPGWYHAVGTRDAAGTMRLYLNGELAGSLSVPEANTTSNAPFTIGAWDDRFGVTELFHGLIEEVSVYNRALSASEVQTIFNAGSVGKCVASSGSSPTAPSVVGETEKVTVSSLLANLLSPFLELLNR